MITAANAGRQLNPEGIGPEPRAAVGEHGEDPLVDDRVRVGIVQH